MTLWPGTVVPVPDVAWAPAHTHDGFLLYATPWKRRPIPDELALRKLLDVDLDSDDAVAAFLDEYGMISKPYFDPGSLPRRAQAELAVEVPKNLRRRATNRVADARWYLRSARALTRHWMAALDGDDLAAAWNAEGFPAGDDEVAWMGFVSHINEGLAAYHVRVERPFGDVPDLTQGEPQAGLYSAMCLQLANHLAEEAIARRCAQCGRPFVRQLGGAAAGQYRTEGVLYCTPQCARAKAAREYRRRKKEGSR
jgi:hypothetical protein